MRHTTAQDNQHTLVFSSWHEFVRYADSAPSELASGARASRSAPMQKQRENHPVVKHWGGYANFTEAIKKSTHGWVEGAAEIAKTFLAFNLPQKRTRPEMAFSPVGPGTLAMGRYIQGHPESFMIQQQTDVTTDQVAYNGGVAHLGINISQSGFTTATERFQMGALLLSLIDLLERNGKRVELTMFNAINGSGGQVAYIRLAVTVKKADSSVNMAILAAAFSNAGTQRRLCWSIRETLDAETRRACGIALKGDMGSTDPDWHTDDCTVVKGLGNVRLHNEASRNDWLKAQLAQQGIEWDGA